jgi:Flp pilus assembly protein TadB
VTQSSIQLMLAILIGLQTATLAGLFAWSFSSKRRHRTNSALSSVLHEFTASETDTFDSNIESLSSSNKTISMWFLKTAYGKWFYSTCVRSGNWRNGQVSTWMARKLEWAIGGLILATLGLQLLSTPTYLLVMFAILGFFGPDLFLYNLGKKRSEKMARALPETIDLLNMTVGAGLGFQAGLDRISRSETNPLSDDFRRVLAEIRLGDSRAHAFNSMAERVNRPEIWSFTNAISRVEKLGIPITNALKDQAKLIRVERREKAREMAQKLPVKILAPIMLLLLPSVLIIVLGPAIFIIMGSL